MAIWGRSWCRRDVWFHSDNAAVMAVIQHQSAKQPAMLHLLHCLYFFAAYCQFSYSAHHLPGVTNVAVDSLSRNHMLVLCRFVAFLAGRSLSYGSIRVYLRGLRFMQIAWTMCGVGLGSPLHNTNDLVSYLATYHPARPPSSVQSVVTGPSFPRQCYRCSGNSLAPR